MISLATFGNELYTGERSYPIVQRRKWWFIIAIAAMVLSGLIVGIKGLNPGIEFRGGTEFTISKTSVHTGDAARDVLAKNGVSEPPRVSTVGTDTVRIQTENIPVPEGKTSGEMLRTVSDELAAAYGVADNDVTSSSVGPSWGADVSKKALQGLVTFMVLVTIVMAAYFRAWRMGLAAILALIHDVIVTIGLYALVGFEVTPASVIGLLTILGYSLYDTVVVFDKVRENTEGLFEQYQVTYEDQANLAVNQTLVRSINTSIVGILPVGSILFVGAFLLGAGTLRDIALALFIGMIISTLSSIFLATPLEVVFRNGEARIKEHTRRVQIERGEIDPEEATVPVSRPKSSAAAKVDTSTDVVEPGQHLGTRHQPRKKKGRR
ncbi:preprotein translocase subunit SecF [Bowdeniella nasicola]|uniref:Protein-export membrane protein SecF n=1 Tax=Bowdeniella nasicola TaxID=208480 RepID=A0A1H3WJI5_9ACTO|nr:protein translocase subunit SecF [Bowdeniella nasicola]SDZ86492.1 preprotein translocase subunit SecF [Bowdeniella nasicola]